MKYRFVLFFAVLIAGLTGYSLLFPNFTTGQLLGETAPYVWVRLLLVAVISAYIISSAVRTYEMRSLLRMGGAILFGYGLAAMVSPMLFGMTDTYVPFGDVLIWLEGGIIAMLLSLEVPLKTEKRASVRIKEKEASAPAIESSGSFSHI